MKNRVYAQTLDKLHDTEFEEIPKFTRRKNEKKKTQLRKLQRRKKKENHYA